MDVISGNAGAIPSLLSMYEVFCDEGIFDLALFLGEELLLSAVKEPANGLSWSSEINGVEQTSHNLTGFSHGAAGIGYSLLELFRKSGDKKFMIAAEQAFNYENSWYSNQNNNWPDFRANSETRKKDTHDSLAYATAWCHGAPGIGLSRLRAYQILKDEKYLKDYKLAQKTILKTIMQERRSNVMNSYSLCHGLFGICEPLVLDGANHLFDNRSLQLVKKIALEAIDRYHTRNRHNAWPCGLQTGQTPGLMLGLTGIGYFCLRLYDIKKIPSILIIIPP
jgi:lantibiotic modifying enzyme